MAKNIITRPSPDLIGQPDINFFLNDFESTIYLKGYDVTVEAMLRCPCKGNQTGALSDCSNCQGTGYVFINPYNTKMILHSMNYNTKFKEWSEENMGKVSVTAMQRDRLSFMDRITVIDSVAVLSELLPLKQINQTKFLYTIYDILSVIDIFTFDSSTLPLRKLVENVDYTFERNKIVILTNDTTGKTFTVRYNHNNQYHILDLVHDIRNSPRKDDNGNQIMESYPINAIARLSHYNITSLDFTGSNLLDNSYTI